MECAVLDNIKIDKMKIIFLLVNVLISHADSMDYQFPKEFMFGSATAAYQIEGGWNEDGKYDFLF